MSREDVEYYRVRAREERALAIASASPEAAKAHAELAGHYEALVRNAELLPPHRRLVDEDEGEAGEAA